MTKILLKHISKRKRNMKWMFFPMTSKDNNLPMAENSTWKSSGHFSLISIAMSLNQFLLQSSPVSLVNNTLLPNLLTCSTELHILWDTLTLNLSIISEIVTLSSCSLLCTSLGLQYPWSGVSIICVSVAASDSIIKLWVNLKLMALILLYAFYVLIFWFYWNCFDSDLPEVLNDNFCLDFFGFLSSSKLMCLSFSTECSICSATVDFRVDGGVLGIRFCRLCTL